MLTRNFAKVATLIALCCFGTQALIGQENTATDGKKSKQETDLKKQEDAKSEDKTDEDEEVTVAGLKAKYNKAYAAFLKAYRAEPDRKKKTKIVREMLPQMNDYIKPVMGIVKKDPKSDEAFEGLLWIASRVRQPKKRDEIMDLVLTHHIDREGMGQFVLGMARSRPAKKSEERLVKIFENNQHDGVKGKAAYALITYFTSVKEMKSNERAIEFYKKAGNDELIEYLEAADNKSLDAKINKYIGIAQKNYADVVLRGELTIGKKIEGIVFERDRLQIGMRVPDIEGEDIDGTEFKLSDYKGKVVMIDFWGDW